MKPSSNPPTSGSQRPEASPDARQGRINQFVSGLSHQDREILTDYLYYDSSNPLAMLQVMRERHGNRFDELAYAIHQLTEDCAMSTDEIHANIKAILDHLAVAALENADTEQAAVVSVRAAMADVADHGPVDPYGRTHISSNPPASSPLPPASPRPAEAAPPVADRREVLLRSYLLEALNDELRAAVFRDVTAVQLSQPMHQVTVALLQKMQESGISYDDARGMVARIITERSEVAQRLMVHPAEKWLIQQLRSKTSVSERGIIYEDVMDTQQKRTIRPVTAALFQQMSDLGLVVSDEDTRSLVVKVMSENDLTMQIARPAILKETPPVPEANGFVKPREQGRDITQSPWGGAKPAPTAATSASGPKVLPKNLVTGFVTKGEAAKAASAQPSPWAAFGSAPAPAPVPTPAPAPVAAPQAPASVAKVTGFVRKGEAPNASESPWANEVDRILFKRVAAWIGKIPDNHKLMLLDVLELDPDDREQVGQMVAKYGPAAFAELAQLHEGLRAIARETRSPFKHLAQFVPIILDGGQILESVPLQPGQKQKDVRTVISPRKKQ